ncbi:peptidylprolyl isomerase [Streptococcus caprae]|uniref:Peptidyl-prolyl cis-trans isomerase n=1 Tax=Streptococcus caprae TaxID=1640501 RepID=A0ABV8CW63_9STRE
MKPYLILGLASLTLLTACSSTSTENSNSTTTTTQTETTTQSAEMKAFLNADASSFPQLSTAVADNEAEVKLVTSKGDITIKLFPEEAPLAVENFLTHAKEGYYNNVSFHRVISDFMIQSGDPKGDGTGGESIWNGKDTTIDSGNGFKNETSPYLYNIRGALAMANAGANTNGSQFYIVQNQQDWSSQLDSTSYPAAIIKAYKSGGYPSLDGSYTVFGQVIEGMDIVDSIAAVKTDSNDKPTEAITITSIEIIKNYTFK